MNGLTVFASDSACWRVLGVCDLLFCGPGIQLASLASLFVLRVRARLPRYCFYVFYPAHLAVVWAVRVLVG